MLLSARLCDLQQHLVTQHGRAREDRARNFDRGVQSKIPSALRRGNRLRCKTLRQLDTEFELDVTSQAKNYLIEDVDMRWTESARLSKEQGRHVAQSFGTSPRITPVQRFLEFGIK